jgi:lipid-A-disaccharide synthase
MANDECPMTRHIFFSVGEPSGDVHGANLLHALRRRDPSIEGVGFGGDRMAAAGCRLHYPLCQLAVMGVRRVLDHASTFARLISAADRYFRKQRPDAVVLIDFPGFNWWVARRAHAHGIPVFYFVPPQLWAWASWRVRKMRRWVDHVFCSLPFEAPWYRERGVAAEYVGHPFFDDLPAQRLDEDFLARVRQEGAPIIALLPGSRNQEVDHNFATLYRAAGRIHAQRDDVRFLVACYKPHQQQRIDDYLRRHAPLPITTYCGRTPEIIELSHSTVSVSGSVSLELLWRTKPSIIVYRMGALQNRLIHWLAHVDRMCLVNLLAGKDLYPEFAVAACPSAAVAEHALHWLNDAKAYSARRSELADLRDRVAAPGACNRTAQGILKVLDMRQAA